MKSSPAPLLSVESFSVPLGDGFSNANTTWQSREGLQIQLRCRVNGLGEASPLPGFSRESTAECKDWLQALDSQPFRPLLAIHSPKALLEKLEPLLAQAPAAVRFGVETAFLDRLAQQREVPVWALLREALPASLDPAQSAGPVPLAAVVTEHSVDAAIESAERLFQQGVRTFKFKIGPDSLHSNQLEQLTALRERWGTTIALRADANQSLLPSEWARFSQAIEGLELELLEEPWPLTKHPWPTESPCPLALDESLHGAPFTAQVEAISRNCCTAVVLKPTALGGLSRSLALAAAAFELHKPTIVSHTLEARTGWLACAHLAVALPNAAAAGLWPLAHQGPTPQGWITPEGLHEPLGSGLAGSPQHD